MFIMPEKASSKGRLLVTTVVASGLLTAACSSGAPDSQPSSTTELDPRHLVLDASAEVEEYIPDLYPTAQMLGVPDFDSIEVQAQYERFDEPYRHMDDVFLPLAEVRLNDDGQLEMEDISPEGMSPDAMEWFGDRIVTEETLVREAMASGRIESVTLALDDDQDAPLYGSEFQTPADRGYIYPHYMSGRKSVTLEISTHANSLSADLVDQVIAHESLHPLFADSPLSVYSDKMPSPESVAALKSACLALREQAFADIQYSTYPVEDALGQFVELEPDPKMAARYALLLEYFQNGEWLNIQPTAIDYADDEDKVPECVMPDIGFLQKVVGDQAGLPPGDNPETFDQAAVEASRTAYSDAEGAFTSLIREHSIYRILMEGTYQLDAPDMGHPQADAEEFVVGAANTMLSFPEDAARKIRVLPDDQKTAVIDAVRLSVDILVETHPNLQGFFADREAAFMAAVYEG
jgi:hypothetical protein